jgi:hypothetical protein
MTNPWKEFAESLTLDEMRLVDGDSIFRATAVIDNVYKEGLEYSQTVAKQRLIDMFVAEGLLSNGEEENPSQSSGFSDTWEEFWNNLEYDVVKGVHLASTLIEGTSYHAQGKSQKEAHVNLISALKDRLVLK